MHTHAHANMHIHAQPVPIKDRGDRDEGGPSAEEEKLQKENKMHEELKDEIQKRSKKSMADGRGIEVLVTAIREHYGGVVVVERACRALAQLSFNSWENAHKICGEDGPRVIAKAMQTQMANAHVLEQACALLKNLFSSFNDAPKGMLLAYACVYIHRNICVHDHIDLYIHTYVHKKAKKSCKPHHTYACIHTYIIHTYICTCAHTKNK